MVPTQFAQQQRGSAQSMQGHNEPYEYTKQTNKTQARSSSWLVLVVIVVLGVVAMGTLSYLDKQEEEAHIS